MAASKRFVSSARTELSRGLGMAEYQHAELLSKRRPSRADLAAVGSLPNLRGHDFSAHTAYGCGASDRPQPATAGNRSGHPSIDRAGRRQLLRKPIDAPRDNYAIGGAAPRQARTAGGHDLPAASDRRQNAPRRPEPPEDHGSRMPTRANSGSTMRSNSRSTGPMRRRSTNHCRAPGSQTPPARRIRWS
jgi:hypothetical protein